MTTANSLPPSPTITVGDQTKAVSAAGKSDGMDAKTCADCGKTAPAFEPGSCCGSFGRDADGADVCTVCCGERDGKTVSAAPVGKLGSIAFYASGDGKTVTNWPGTLKAPASATPYRRAGAFYGTPQRRVYWTCEGRRMSGTEYNGVCSGNLLRNVRILKG